MNALSFRTCALTQAGGRSQNEDACDYCHGCWVVADGLGGHGGGEVAARIAVDTVLAAAKDAPPMSVAALTDILAAAAAAIHARQEAQPRLIHMRTTVVVLASDGRRALWAHIGDTRLYHLRAGRIRIQTADHSVPQAMVNAGELPAAAIRFHEDRNRLLRSLGDDKALRPTVAPAPLELLPGDAFLLCTDGFWEHVTEGEMEVALAKSATPDEWLKTMVEGLVRRAAADHDNYSAIALFVDPMDAGGTGA